MKTLEDFDFRGKRVLLRTDLNSDVQNKRLLKSERIKEAAITIKELKKKGARIIIIAHQGRPGEPDFISLKQHCRQLNKYTKVKFVDDIIGEKAERAINELKDGEAILLENIRNLKEEFDTRKNKITDFFSRLCDIYVNDAFSVCHREQSSILLPKYIKKSCAGRLLEKEVNALKKIRLKNTLYILGGAKPEDNIKLLGKNNVLSCGLFGQVCLINKGKKLGEQENYLIKNKIFIKIPKEKLRKVETPVDFAVEINGRKEISLSGFPNKHEIFDIGSETQKKYASEIRKAKAIYMKGPAGDCGKRGFSDGTFAILKAIANSKSFSVIGGGHLSDAIEASGIDKRKFGHISLSGGALLSYIAGEKTAWAGSIEMKLIKVGNYRELSRKASEIIINEISRKPNLAIGFATGKTQRGLYRKLSKAYRKNKIDFSKIKTFNLDELYPLKENDRKSYHNYMFRHLFNKINVKRENINLLNGEAKNFKKECKDYEDKIKRNPIDIQILGIGINGHIGFNEPGSRFNSKTRLVELTHIKGKALTMGISTIMKSKKIILLASGRKKAKAVSGLVRGKINKNLPASFLRKHKNLIVIIDEKAGSLL